MNLVGFYQWILWDSIFFRPFSSVICRSLFLFFILFFPAKSRSSYPVRLACDADSIICFMVCDHKAGMVSINRMKNKLRHWLCTGCLGVPNVDGRKERLERVGCLRRLRWNNTTNIIPATQTTLTRTKVNHIIRTSIWYTTSFFCLLLQKPSQVCRSMYEYVPVCTIAYY